MVNANPVHPVENYELPETVADVIYDWRQCLQQLELLALAYDAITVNYLPQAIYAHTDGDCLPDTWIIRPSTWQVSFWQLEPFGKGYKAQILPLNLTIAYGKPQVKHTRSTDLSSTYV